MSDRNLEQTDFSFPGQLSVYHGKVRDVYILDDNRIILVATDRISAFDVILPRLIPYKGQVLNQLAEYFLEQTKDIVPNWLRSVPDPNASMGVVAEPLKLEMIVRGILVGSAWRDYQSGTRELCGVTLPEDMKEYSEFSSPIITPTTKAEEGHDENISPEQLIAKGIVTIKQWEQLSDYALALFKRGQQMARERGLLLADTKYEFGVVDGEIILIDEVHTPDSSRYYHEKSYHEYVSGESAELPKQLSKEFVRSWLIDNGFNIHSGSNVPDMTDEFVDLVSSRYIELYELLTGKQFVKTNDESIVARVERNIQKAIEVNDER
jgi:phosphoribosylaminoimidazole-succinocarboxamide synthase